MVSPLDPEHSKLRKGTVAILSRGKPVGTGFFVSRQLVTTCAHVVSRSGDNVLLELFNGKTIHAVVEPDYWRDKKAEDIAILRLKEALPEEIEPLWLGTEANTEDHEFKTYGFPDLHPQGMNGNGTVGATFEPRKNIWMIQLDSKQITHGFSGAPVFNETTQRVIGIISEIVFADLEERKFKDKTHIVPAGRLENIAFATPSSVLLKICPELRFNHICPYKSLLAFTQEDAKFFWGRDRLVEVLIRKLQDCPQFLAVMGASGSGKSSIVQAKLLPKIQAGEIAGFQHNTPVIRLRFTHNEAPEITLYKAFPKVKPSEGLQSDKWEQIQACVDGYSDRVVIFIDQFEQLFGQFAKDLDQAHEFLDRLSNLLKKNYQLTIILTVRIEFYPQLERCLGEWIASGHQVVQGIPGEHLDLGAVITAPAKEVGLRLDDGLEAILKREVSKTQNPLPLLEFTLTQLWEIDNPRNQLTRQTYDQIGGMTGALARWATQIYDYEISEVDSSSRKHRSEEQKVLFRRILARLVQFGANDAPDTHRRVNRTELEKSIGIDISVVLNQMADTRLIVIDQQTVEIVHDALIEEWLKKAPLGEWLEQRRKFYFWLQRFEERFNERQQQEKSGGRSKTIWLTEPYLTEAEGYLKAYPDELQNVEQRSYIIKSRKRVNRGRNLSLSLLSVGFLIVSGFAIFSHKQSQIAKSLHLKSSSEAAMESDTTRSLLLAAQSVAIQDMPQSNGALWKAFQANHERIRVDTSQMRVERAEYAPGNSKQILTLGTDGTAQIWNLDQPQTSVINLSGHKGALTSGGFSPKSARLALTTSHDGTARVWNLEGTGAPTWQELSNDRESINYGCFDQNAQQVLTVGSAGSVKVWTMDDPTKPIKLVGHQGEVYYGAFDPNNPVRLLTVGNDGTARVWDLKDPKKSIVLRGHTGGVLYGAFDPKNSDRVATVGTDNTLRVWSIQSPDKPKVFKGHTRQISMLKFNPFDPGQILTISEDGTARIWNIDKAEQPEVVLKGRSESLSFGDFSRTIGQVVIAGKDGIITIWDVSDRANPKSVSRLLGHRLPITHISFDANNSNQVLTSSEDGTARVWDIINSTDVELNPVRKAPEPKNLVFAAAPGLNQEQQLFTLNRSGEFEKWTLNGSDRPERINKTTFGEVVSSYKRAFISPVHSKFVVTTDEAGQAYFYDFKQNRPPTKAMTNQEINNVSFDIFREDRVALISRSIASIWNTKTPVKIGQISNPSGDIGAIVFHPRSSDQIILGSNDGSLSAWRIGNSQAEEIWKKNIASDVIWDIKIDPKNQDRILVVGADQTARIWSLNQQKEEIAITSHKDTLTSGRFDLNNSDRFLTIGQRGEVYVHSLDAPNDPTVLDVQDIGVDDAFFDTLNPNRVIVIGKNGVVRVFLIGGSELLRKSFSQSSRCLSDDEAKQYEIQNYSRNPFLTTFFDSNIVVLWIKDRFSARSHHPKDNC
jgi:WD40 repeat protein